MPEIVLACVIAFLLAERWFSTRTATRERRNLQNALIAKTAAEARMLDAVPEAPKAREPKPRRFEIVEDIEGFEGQAGIS